MLKEINALVISEDAIFSAVLYRFMLNNCLDVVIKNCRSFSEVKSLHPKEKIDVIFLDDTISGAANHEVVSFLRYDKQILAPVYYFSNVESEEKKALQRGANFFFKKPFNPEIILNHIKSSI
jgi:DNA-binding response OmpR family regulator